MNDTVFTHAIFRRDRDTFAVIKFADVEKHNKKHPADLLIAISDKFEIGQSTILCPAKSLNLDDGSIVAIVGGNDYDLLFWKSERLRYVTRNF